MTSLDHIHLVLYSSKEAQPFAIFPAEPEPAPPTRNCVLRPAPSGPRIFTENGPTGINSSLGARQVAALVKITSNAVV